MFVLLSHREARDAEVVCNIVDHNGAEPSVSEERCRKRNEDEDERVGMQNWRPFGRFVNICASHE